MLNMDAATAAIAVNTSTPRAVRAIQAAKLIKKAM
jgi:hypothetical protein